MPKGRLNFETWRKTLTEGADRREYIGEDLRCVAMPLGGIGTGSIALCGDGSLRQWQVVNQVNHNGYVPHSFFGLWVAPHGWAPITRVLQSRAFLDDVSFKPVPNVSDHMVPREMKRWLEGMPCIRDTRFFGEYPNAMISYQDEQMPLDLNLNAFSPFRPFDSTESGIPAILFEFHVRNRLDVPVRVALLASLQNFVGWDGVSLITGVQNPGYGANQNRMHWMRGCPTLEMINAQLPDDHPHWGELALAAFADDVTALPQWDDPQGMWHDFVQDGRFPRVADASPSAPWRTWNGALSAFLQLEPNGEAEVTFVLAWYFPNRYVNWRQPANIINDPKSRFYLGNYYNRFGSVMPVVQHVYQRRKEMRDHVMRFRDNFYASSQPYWFLDAITANIVPARTNITFRTEDGTYHGFEGGCGASTSSWSDMGGCCPLDCTHVWNYEMTVSRLWPDLMRTMRNTDWLVNQHPSGYLPHRTPLPVYLPRLWGTPIGGPEIPAMDGLLGGVLKTCREFLACGDMDFLATCGPHVDRALDYVMDKHDTDGDGVLKGEQGNTYDIHLYGPNTFIGSLYLAALLAGARLAEAVGDEARAKRYRERFEVGSKNYDEVCWNGEYYEQIVDLKKHSEYQYASGCASDQLLGQWWAHVLGLGYVLPKDHVRKALAGIWKYNFRDGFENFQQDPRVFASPHDRGLLIAAYPKSRPKVPLLYSDEVWTGVEYTVAALMIYEGLIGEGLAVVKAARDRYDGYERNPWNEVECGDHYVRAMSSWSLLDLSLGLTYEADRGRIRFSPRWGLEEFVSFFTAGAAYGLYRQHTTAGHLTARIEIHEGLLELNEVCLTRPGKKAEGECKLGNKVLAAQFVRKGDEVRVRFDKKVVLMPPRKLEIRLP